MPLSDQLPSLSIGATVVAPRDRLGNPVTAVTPVEDLVVYAGVGGASSFVGLNGFNIGLLRSANGGATWSLLAAPTLAGVSITRIIVLDTGSDDENAQTVLVAGVTGTKGGGVFRSVDSGVTFTRTVVVSTSDLVADPAVSGRLYAARIGGNGIARSDDFGVNWVPISIGLDQDLDNIDNNGDGVADDLLEIGGTHADRIRLAIRQDPAASSVGAGANPVYAALISPPGPFNRSHLMGIFQSTPTATGAAPVNWTQTDWTLTGPAGVVAPANPTGALNRGATNAASTTNQVSFDGPTTSITRTNGSWGNDGFTPGQRIVISGATGAAAANNTGSSSRRSPRRRTRSPVPTGPPGASSPVSRSPSPTSPARGRSSPRPP